MLHAGCALHGVFVMHVRRLLALANGIRCTTDGERHLSFGELLRCKLRRGGRHAQKCSTQGPHH